MAHRAVDTWHDVARMWEYRARLERVIDGDTIRVVCDLGFDAHHRVDLRLLGVSAPELSQPGGTAARDFVNAWVASVEFGLRWPLFVVTERTSVKEPSEVRSFARYVGEVWPVNSLTASSLNAALDSWLLAGMPDLTREEPPTG